MDIGLITPGMAQHAELEVFDMPVCPFCGNAMIQEPVVIVQLQGALGLAHEFCYQDLIDEFEGPK